MFVSKMAPKQGALSGGLNPVAHHHHHPPSTWACLAVGAQAVTRVPLSFCMSPRLANAIAASAQTIQLLVPVALNYIDALQHSTSLHFRRPTATASSCHSARTPARWHLLQLTQQRPHSPHLLALYTAASATTEAVSSSSLNSPSSHALRTARRHLLHCRSCCW
jgi:hypothetical protein